MKNLILIILLVIPTSTIGQEDNPRLSTMFNQDQKMRNKENIKNWPLFPPHG